MFRKKLYYSVLISAVFLTFEPVFAAEIHVSTWAELKSAIENGIDGAGAGGTVYLDKNIYIPFRNPITTAVPGIVIDGQGNTIFKDNTYFLNFSSSAQTDLQIKNVFFENFGDYNTITNEGTLGNINADFINNGIVSPSSRDVRGGVVYNSGTIGDITGDFSDNYIQAGTVMTSALGGVIYNSRTIGDITGDFTNNYAQSDDTHAYGGAIYNMNGGTIGDITGDFGGNYAQADDSYAYGGAIYNYGTIGDITGDFGGNYAQAGGINAYGGAIYNMNGGTIGDITGDFTNNYAQSDDFFAYGGAIFNMNGGTIGDITGDFGGNYAQADKAYGGVIDNIGTIGDITGDFSGNYATGSKIAQGGAIVNGSNGTMTLTNSSFYDNYAQADNGDAFGGAIYNNGTMNITNSSFYDNYIQTNRKTAQGGAIYNWGNMTITADNGVSEFSGNKIIHNDADGNKVEDSEAIYNAGSLTLNAVNNGVIRFDDKINSVYGDIMERLSHGGRYDVVSDNAGGYYAYDGEDLMGHLALTESGYVMRDYSSIISEDKVAAGLEQMENQGAQITQQGDDYHIVMDGQEIDLIKVEDGYVLQTLVPAGLPGITITGDDSMFPVRMLM